MYDFEKSSDVHNKLYITKINVEKINSMLFKLKQEVSEDAIFKDLKAKKIEHTSIVVDLGSVNDEKFKECDEQFYSYLVDFETIKGSSIILTLSLVVASIIGIFLVFRMIKKNNNIKNSKKYSSKYKSIDVRNKEKRKILDESEKKLR